MVGIAIGGFFIPGLYQSTNLLISGFGTVLFVGMAFVDFYTMPRTYRDDHSAGFQHVSHFYQPFHLRSASDHCPERRWPPRLTPRVGLNAQQSPRNRGFCCLRFERST